MGMGVYRMGVPVNQTPVYTPEGVVMILLNEDFMLKRDFAGYYIKRRGEKGHGAKFDPEHYLDAVEFLAKDEVHDKYEERLLAGKVYLRKRPQEVNGVNVGIYSLIDKGDFLPDEVSISPKRVLFALRRLAQTPEELLVRAPFRTQVPMFSDGKTIRAGQKMG